MSGEPSDRPTSTPGDDITWLNLPDLQAAFVSIFGLSAVLEIAIEAAISQEGSNVDDKSARLDLLVEQLLREAKNVLTEYVSETSEAAGMHAVITVVNEVVRRVRQKIGG